MSFIKADLETILPILDRLEEHQQATWGSMCPQRMVEHLTDNLQMAMAQQAYTLSIPEERISRMQDFLWSEKPMAKLIKVDFAPENYELRHASLLEAKAEFVTNWKAYERYFASKPETKTLHPFYGLLDKELWDRLISKHFTHHFHQFNLLNTDF